MLSHVGEQVVSLWPAVPEGKPLAQGLRECGMEQEWDPIWVPCNTGWARSTLCVEWPLGGGSQVRQPMGVSGHVRLGRGRACGLSGIWPGHEGVEGGFWAPSREKGPAAPGVADVEAALGAGLSAGSRLSAPVLPTSCPQALKAAAAHPRGHGGRDTTGACQGTWGPALTRFLKLELLATLQGGREGGKMCHDTEDAHLQATLEMALLSLMGSERGLAGPRVLGFGSLVPRPGPL